MARYTIIMNGAKPTAGQIPAFTDGKWQPADASGGGPHTHDEADITDLDHASPIASAIATHAADVDAHHAPSAGIMQIPWHSAGNANFALTNSPSAARIAFNQPTRMVKFAPLASFTQVRLMGVQVTTSASANTPLLRLRYKTGAYSATVGDYLQLGASEVEFTLTGTGARDSGWIDLVVGAQADVQLALIELGGDGVADPALGHVHAYFQ